MSPSSCLTRSLLFCSILAFFIVLAFAQTDDGLVGLEPEDDSELRADDSSILSIQSQLEKLKKREEQMRIKREHISHKLDLIRRVQRARSKLAISKIELSDAYNELDMRRQAKEQAKERRTSNFEEKEAIAARRRETEKLIESVKGNAMNIKERKEALLQLQKAAQEQQKAMEEKRDEALLVLKTLGNEFKTKGLEKWIKYNSENLPVIVKGSIQKATEAFAPLANKLESVAEANGVLTHEVAVRLHQMLPSIKQSPFYEGILFYLILLVPTVFATGLVVRIHARLAQLTIAHYVIAINLYFGTMSVLCLFMSLLSRNDILIVFRHRSQSAFEAFTLLHAFLFVLHLTVHAIVAYVSKSSKDLGQLVSMCCVGLHFFVHEYKRAILNQDPNIGAPAYFLYSIIFMYTLYDRGITILEVAVTNDKTGVDPYATVAPIGPTFSGSREHSGKKSVYFAGLPVFSSNQSGGNDDAKNI